MLGLVVAARRGSALCVTFLNLPHPCTWPTSRFTLLSCSVTLLLNSVHLAHDACAQVSSSIRAPDSARHFCVCLNGLACLPTRAKHCGSLAQLRRFCHALACSRHPTSNRMPGSPAHAHCARSCKTSCFHRAAEARAQPFGLGQQCTGQRAKRGGVPVVVCLGVLAATAVARASSAPATRPCHAAG